MKKDDKKVITLEDRKEAQPNALFFLTDAERATLKQTIAKSLDEGQYKLFIYTCQALGLNPLLNEIAAVVFSNTKTGEKDMSIQVMRDGFLSIAHRSGKFGGIESGVYEPGDETIHGRKAKQLIGWAKVYHKDFQVPVYQEAEFNEYDNTSRNLLWKTKPKTMIKKVAESMALRKAFNVNGVYAPEELDKEITSSEKPQVIIEVEEDKEATEAQKATIKTLMKYDDKEADDKDYIDDLVASYTYKEAAMKIRELSSSHGKAVN